MGRWSPLPGKLSFGSRGLFSFTSFIPGLGGQGKCIANPGRLGFAERGSPFAPIRSWGPRTPEAPRGCPWMQRCGCKPGRVQHLGEMPHPQREPPGQPARRQAGPLSPVRTPQLKRSHILAPGFGQASALLNPGFLT